MSYFYSVESEDDTARYPMDHCLRPKDFQEYDAAEAAEDYHDNQDGWDGEWPLTITLYETLESAAIGKYKVEREDKVVFYAREITE